MSSKKQTAKVGVIDNTKLNTTQETVTQEVDIKELTDANIVTGDVINTMNESEKVEVPTPTEETVELKDSKSEKMLYDGNLLLKTAEVFVSANKTINTVQNKRIMTYEKIIETLMKTEHFSIGFTRETSSDSLKILKRILSSNITVRKTLLSVEFKDKVFERISTTTNIIDELTK